MRTGRPAKYQIELSEEERDELKGLVKRGTHAARKLTRAQMLLLADEGRKQQEIESVLKVSNSTICSIEKRYCEAGLSAALEERPRPGAKGKLDAKGEAHLIAVACSEAPEGRESWTMQLLAEQLVELGIVDEISDETVRLTLKKKLKPKSL
jgi:transposase